MELKEQLKFRSKNNTIILGFNQNWKFTKKIILDNGKESKWATTHKELIDKSKAKEVLENIKKAYLERERR